MSISKGSVSFRVLRSNKRMGLDLITRMQDCKQPDVFTDTEVSYWVNPRPVGSVNIATLRSSKKQVAKFDLDQAVAAALEREAMIAGSPIRNRTKRKQIRQECYDALLPNARIIHRDIELAWPENSNFIYTTATADSAVDKVVFRVHQDVDASLRLNVWDVNSIAGDALYALGQCNIKALSPDTVGVVSETLPGDEFLTWLWYLAEKEKPEVHGLALAVSAPITLRDGMDECVITITGSGATRSSEASRALYRGNILAKVKVMTAEDVKDVAHTRVYNLTRGLVVSGFKPDAHGTDDAALPDRVMDIDNVRAELELIVKDFLIVRCSEEHWDERVIPSIRNWINKKIGGNRD